MRNKILIMIIILTIILLIIITFTIYIINSNQDKEVNVELLNEGGAEYEVSQLDNFEFEILGLNDEILSEINIDTLKLEMKEYVYLEGLVDANQALLQNWNTDNNVLYLEFLLNNENNTIINIEVNLSTNRYTITS